MLRLHKQSLFLLMFVHSRSCRKQIPIMQLPVVKAEFTSRVPIYPSVLDVLVMSPVFGGTVLLLRRGNFKSVLWRETTGSLMVLFDGLSGCAKRQSCVLRIGIGQPKKGRLAGEASQAHQVLEQPLLPTVFEASSSRPGGGGGGGDFLVAGFLGVEGLAGCQLHRV